METKGFIQFEIIINVLVISSRIVWIPMLWVYWHLKSVTLSLQGSSLDVRFWRSKDDPRAGRFNGVKGWTIEATATIPMNFDLNLLLKGPKCWYNIEPTSPRYKVINILVKPDARVLYPDHWLSMCKIELPYAPLPSPRTVWDNVFCLLRPPLHQKWMS